MYETSSGCQQAFQVLPKEKKTASAIQHYNTAIKEIVSNAAGRSGDAILICCILFICIEFLCGDSKTATRHIGHGIAMVNSTHVSEDLVAVLRHLSIIPYFFGMNTTSFPLILDQRPVYEKAPARICELEVSLDLILYRIATLTQASDGRTFGVRTSTASAEITTGWHQELEQEMNDWHVTFQTFQKKRLPKSHFSTCQLQDKYRHALLLLEARWIIVRIWGGYFRSSDEDVLDLFRRVIDLAAEAQKYHAVRGVEESMFGIGFGSLLYFIVARCRELRVRIAALSVMSSLVCSREPLWTQPISCAIAKRLIEFEHRISLERSGGIYVPSTEGHSSRMDGQCLLANVDVQQV